MTAPDRRLAGLREALEAAHGPVLAGRLFDRYGRGLSPAHLEEPPELILADIAALERLAAADEHRDADAGAVSSRTRVAEGGRLRCRLVGTSGPWLLSTLVPTFAGFGLAVAEQRRLHVHAAGRAPGWVDEFDLVPGGEVPREALASFDEALEAVLRGAAEADGFNALVLTAGLSWRQVTALRGYAKYLRQGGWRFSHDYLEQAVTANPEVAALLVELFEARFDPCRPGGAEREAACRELRDRLEQSLQRVTSLDQDRILRGFLAVVLATQRTDHFQRDDDGRPHPYLSVKLDPQLLPDLPAPRPRHEIFVCSPRFEGVHLRFGAVARGGLRWSDRPEDFRTEILGLVKAQAVKNAVIVPAGAKGGFVCKRLPDPADREAWLAEGIACYRQFVGALLGLTDNLVDGRPVPPPRVVRHDGDDPYLVVAADKGTATFSDIANEVARDHGFWLDDAFASGGTTGYDHKAMGITARGAWESVKRHFREAGRDPEREPITVVGIGDMSGDVFGNGMLLSDRIELVAAFDHRHVFLDPDPDAAGSYAERRRLFGLPRSSWADYDPRLISAGGGVHPRTAKSIPLSARVRERLGIPGHTETATPDEVIRAILTAPVDLVWNGGIGTYVKAAAEDHAEVGDKANDAVRVDAAQLRCRVVGEGGNLGLTQRARIEFARRGGRVNTDALDNSAGVDTSDHEVNLKILLDRPVRDGVLSLDARNLLLARMQDDVAELVLANNYRQNLRLSLAEACAPESLDRHAALIRFLEREGYLDRAQEFLPDDDGLAALDAAGAGLSRPELAVLIAHSKRSLKDDLDASDVPDDPYLLEQLGTYFPALVRRDHGDRMVTHPLRREIVTTSLVNDLVDHVGPGFVHRLEERTPAGTADVVRAYVIARDVFGLPAVWSSLSRAGHLPPQAELLVLEDSARLLEEAAAWLLRHRPLPLSLGEEVGYFREAVQALARSLPGTLDAASRADLDGAARARTEAGMPPELARSTALLGPLAAAFDVIELAREGGCDPAQAAAVHFATGERLGLRAVRAGISAAPVDSHWTALAKAALLDELGGQHRRLTGAALRCVDSQCDTGAAVHRWARASAPALARWDTVARELRRGDRARLATMVVAVQALRDVADSGPRRNSCGRESSGAAAGGSR